VERDGAPLNAELFVGAADDQGERVGRIGAAPQVSPELWDPVRTEQRFGPVGAVGQAVSETWRMSALTVTMMGRMILGQVSVKNISGPINIAQAAGFTAAAGVTAFLSFLAIVSISLGIINLLPIPLAGRGTDRLPVCRDREGQPGVRPGPDHRPAGGHPAAADADDLRVLQRHRPVGHRLRCE
jgi:regulator of sigma E protease